jgi:1,4-dihydroxy-2-naphthoyl-CoA hydrolase
MTFYADHTVRFSQVDGANILFFSRLFEVCHHAFEDAMVELGHALPDVFEAGVWKMPIVHAEADYVAPMRLGDRVRIGVWVKRVGTRSLTWAFRVEGEGGALKATACHVHACIDAEFRGRDLPEDLVGALERLGWLHD